MASQQVTCLCLQVEIQHRSVRCYSMQDLAAHVEKFTSCLLMAFHNMYAVGARSQQILVTEASSNPLHLRSY